LVDFDRLVTLVRFARIGTDSIAWALVVEPASEVFQDAAERLIEDLREIPDERRDLTFIDGIGDGDGVGEEKPDRRPGQRDAHDGDAREQADAEALKSHHVSNLTRRAISDMTVPSHFEDDLTELGGRFEPVLSARGVGQRERAVDGRRQLTAEEVPRGLPELAFRTHVGTQD